MKDLLAHFGSENEAKDEIVPGQPTGTDATAGLQRTKSGKLWGKGITTVVRAVHKKRTAAHVASAFQSGLTLTDEEIKSAAGLAKARPLETLDVDESLLSIAEKLAGGSRRVCALQHGKVVWTISQERFVSFLHIEHNLHYLQTGETAITGNLSDWGFKAGGERFDESVVRGETLLVDCLELMDQHNLRVLGVTCPDSGVLIGTLQLSSFHLLVTKLTVAMLETKVQDFIKQSKTLLEDINTTCSYFDNFVDVFSKFAQYHCQSLYVVDGKGIPIGRLAMKVTLTRTRNKYECIS